MSDSSIVFDHVHLIGKDPDATASWYSEKLGGNIVGSGEVLGSKSIRVAFEGATVIIRGKRADEAPQNKDALEWGTDHFGFQVKGDFDAFCDDLKKKGVAFTMDPVNLTPAICIAFIEAPDGVSIELLQRK